MDTRTGPSNPRELRFSVYFHSELWRVQRLAEKFVVVAIGVYGMILGWCTCSTVNRE